MVLVTLIFNLYSPSVRLLLAGAEITPVVSTIEKEASISLVSSACESVPPEISNFTFRPPEPTAGMPDLKAFPSRTWSTSA